jgi:undecaprenyl-diphosphatase
MNWLQSIAIAILQGATELFPVSSLGHAVVLPGLLGMKIDQGSTDFLPFIVMLHLGTAVALLAYFWRDWWSLGVVGLGFGAPEEVYAARKMVVLIVVATIPAALAGFLLEKIVRGLFATPIYAAAFLVANGVLLLFGEGLRAKTHRPLYALTWVDALFIGCFQCLALLPGISRSGATMVAGLLRGVNHAGSAHFSFLIATPIIFGATLHQVPKLLHAQVQPGVFLMASVAAVVAGITAWLTTWLLMRFFRTNDNWALTPFALYCLAFGGISVLAYRFWL